MGSARDVIRNARDRAGFATIGACSAGLVGDVESWSALVAGGGNGVAISAVVNGTNSASTLIIKLFTESAFCDGVADTLVVHDVTGSAGCAGGGIFADSASSSA